MPRKFNPATGQWEEDLTPPAGLMNAQPPPVAPATPPVVPPVSIFPPKPASETSTVRTVESPQSAAARTQLAVARGANANAQEALGATEAAEATALQPVAADKVKTLEQAQADAAAVKAETERKRAEHLSGRKAQIEDEAKAQVKSGNAKEDLLGDGWGAFLAALLQGIGQAAHQLGGGQGASPAERVLDKRIAGHKEKLLAEWQAKKDVRELKDKDFAAYEQAQRDKQEEISKDVQKQLAIYQARIEKVSAQFAPEKKARMTEAGIAATRAADAKEDLDAASRFDMKIAHTERSADPAAALAKPPPTASTEDVEKVKGNEEAARDLEELAEKIEKAGKSWKNLQDADMKQQREERGNIKGYGVGAIAGNIESQLPAGLYRAVGATPGGVSVEDKLRDDKAAQDIWRGIEAVKTKIAKGYGGAITGPDAQRAGAELGVQGQDTEGMAATLRKRASDHRAKAEEMRRQRTFR